MLSNYFKIKTNTNDFKIRLNSIINELKDKKVVIYGAGKGFYELNKKYKFNKILNIIGIADKKFIVEQEYNKLRAIPPENITEEEYDYILISNESYNKILDYLIDTLKIDKNKIRTIFEENIKDASISINHAEYFKFSKTLKKLKKKIKNKTVVIYGAGVFFEAIKEYYDISDINIIGISDKIFENHNENEECFGYKVYSPEEIRELNPDYVLVCMQSCVNVIENLYFDTLKGTKIKIRPLIKKDLWTLIKEIWNLNEI